MVGNAMEQARDERNAQLARYRQLKAQQLDELCHGQYGEEISDIVKMLKHLTIDDANRLVVKVANAQWLLSADANTRHAVLSIIDDAIIRLRIRNGLPPFDDTIAGGGDGTMTAFQIVRHKLTGV